MNEKYFKKYLKYKNKYNELKGGSYAVYTNMSRLNFSEIPTLIASRLLNEAVELRRFYHKYIDQYSHEEMIEGISSAFGPIGFKGEDYDTHKLNIDSYESILIYPILIRLNELLKKYKIKTIQSQISYYDDDYTFGEPYFQLPFIEFTGNKDRIPILKEIANHTLFKDYYITAFPQISEDESVMRLTIMRPYFKNGNQISGFDDSIFWENIESVIQEISDKNIPIIDFSINDPELDKSKPWYILDGNGELMEVMDKDSFNPLIPSMPLSVLDVRYEMNYNLFKYKL